MRNKKVIALLLSIVLTDSLFFTGEVYANEETSGDIKEETSEIPN